MGTQSVPTVLRGVIVHDPRFSHANLATTSTATQTSPFPGQPERTAGDGSAELLASGMVENAPGDRWVFGQAAGGFRPGREGRIAWDDASTGATRRGHLPYTVLTGFEWAAVVAGPGDYANPHAIALPSGRLYMVYYKGTGIDGRYRDPLTNTWATVTVSTSAFISASSTVGPTILRTDEGRLICLYETIDTAGAGGDVTLSQSYSDDDGATWTQGTEHIPGFRETAAALGTRRKLRAVFHKGFITVAISSTVGILTLRVSSDLGASFDTPAASSMGAGAAGFGFEIVACPAGDVLVFFAEYVGGVTPTFYCARKATPYGSFSTAFALFSDGGVARGPDVSGSVGHIAACVDLDGTIWCAARLRDASTSATASSRYRLLHMPETITAVADLLYEPLASNTVDAEILDLGATAARLDVPTLVPHQGSLVLLSNATTGAGTADGWISALFLGGWSTLTWNGATAGFAPSDLRYGLAYLAISTPGSAWTATGAGGSLNLTTSTDGLQFTNAAAAQRYFGRTGTATLKPVIAWARMKVTTGGSLAATEVFVRLIQANGVIRYRVALRFSSTAARLFDINATAAVGTDVTGLAADTFRDWVVVLDSGIASVFYRAVGDTEWVAGPTGAVSSAAAVDTNTTEWGVDHSGNTDCTWKMLWSCMDNANMPVVASIISAVAKLRGRPIATSSQWLDAGVGYAARGGPITRGDAWKIGQRYGFGLQNADPMIQPSPGVQWVSQDATEQTARWDFSTEIGMLSSSIGVALLAPRFRLAYLERWNGITWVTTATIDAADGFTSLTYDRVGTVMTPNVATAAGARTLVSGDYRGGYVLFDEAADLMRQIDDHSDGVWRASGSRLLEIRLAGDMSAIPTTGTCHIIAPSVATVIHNVTQTPTRWRLRIGASSADYALALGNYVIGPFLPWGRQDSRGKTYDMEQIQRISEDERGHSRVEWWARRRAVEVQWTDPTTSHDQYGSAPSPAYVSANASYPGIALLRDHRRLEGLTNLTRGASRPVVYLPSVGVGATDTLCGPDELVYGRIISGNVTRTAVLGNENQNEVSTAGKILIREEL